jgi:small subunit ribosomal protein S16
MATRIRLRRVGRKKQPEYRIVVAESEKARDGRVVETLGHYNPRTEPVTITVDAEKAREAGRRLQRARQQLSGPWAARTWRSRASASRTG